MNDEKAKSVHEAIDCLIALSISFGTNLYSETALKQLNDSELFLRNLINDILTDGSNQ